MVKNYILWLNHVRKDCKAMNYAVSDTVIQNFAKNQWDLYWAGVRDSRLADVSIYLIDTYGYKGGAP